MYVLGVAESESEVPLTSGCLNGTKSYKLGLKKKDSL